MKYLFFTIFFCLLSVSSVFAGELREVIAERGTRVRVDTETHRVYIQAVNDIFGPGIPLRNDSRIINATNQQAASLARTNTEIEALRHYRPEEYHLHTTEPTPEQIRQSKDHPLIDAPSIPDPDEKDLPYQLQCQGPERNELLHLYQHLYKIDPLSQKRQTARELGLISIEEADHNFKNGTWKHSLSTREVIKEGGWELIFSQRSTDLLPVIIHARPLKL